MMLPAFKHSGIDARNHQLCVVIVAAVNRSRDLVEHLKTPIAKFMGPTWGPPGADRTQVGPVLALWTLLSGNICNGQMLHHWSTCMRIDMWFHPTIQTTYNYLSMLKFKLNHLKRRDNCWVKYRDKVYYFFTYEIWMSNATLLINRKSFGTRLIMKNKALFSERKCLYIEKVQNNSWKISIVHCRCKFIDVAIK